MDIKKITSYVAENVQNPRGPAAANGEDRTVPSGGVAGDRVQLSKDYQDLVQAQKEMVNSAEIRTDKIDKIRDQINSGTYEINPSVIANKMMDEMF